MLLSCFATASAAQEAGDERVAAAISALHAGRTELAAELLRDEGADVEAKEQVADQAYVAEALSSEQLIAMMQLAFEQLSLPKYRARIAVEHTKRRRYAEAIDAYVEVQDGLTEQRWVVWFARALLRLYCIEGQVHRAYEQLARLEAMEDFPVALLELCRADLLSCAGNAELGMRALRRSGAVPKLGQPIVTAQDEQAIRVWFDLELSSERFRSVVERADDLLAQGFRSPLVRFAKVVAMERLARPGAVAALEAFAGSDGTSADEQRSRDRCRAILADRALRANDLAATRRWLAAVEGSDELDVLLVTARLQVAEHAPAQTLRATLSQLDAWWRRWIDGRQRLPVLAGGAAFLQLARRRELLATSIACRLALAPGAQHRAAVAQTAVQMLLQADALGSLARRADVAAADLDDVMRLSPARGATLFLLPAGSQSFVMMASERGWELFAAPGDRGLRDLVRAVNRELTSVHNDRARSLEVLERRGRELRDRVLPPRLRERLRDVERVAIVGRGLVGGCHFECLPWDDEHGWLGLAKALHCLPNVALAAAHDAMPWRAAGPDLRLISPQVDVEVAQRWNVPAAALLPSELAAIAAASAAVEVHAGDTVTAASVLAPDRPARVTALFAHGVYDHERVCPAGILLPADGEQPGAVFFEQVVDRSRGFGDIALLCTCGAGRGTLRRGDDGAWHVGGAMMVAGTRIVAISDFNLEVAGTVRLVRELLLATARTPSLDLAMLAARRRVAAELGARPTNWGLLRLEGPAARRLPETFAPLPARASRRGMVVLGLAGLLVIVAIAGCVWLSRRSSRAGTAAGSS